MEDLESDLVQQTMTNETYKAEKSQLFSRLAKLKSDLEQITRENMRLRHEVHFMRQALQVTYVAEKTSQLLSDCTPQGQGVLPPGGCQLNSPVVL